MSCAPASAQTSVLANPTNVTNRSRPQYDALGINLGAWSLLPSLSVNDSYDSNIYNTNKARSDLMTMILPKMTLKSNSEIYSANFVAGANIQRFLRTDTENSVQYNFAANGAFDLSRNTEITGRIGFDRAIEPRGSAGDTIVGGEPITYNLLRGNVGLKHIVGRVSLEATTGVSRYAYETEKVNGTSLSQSYRDVMQYSETARATYGLTPSLGVYLGGAFGQSVYRQHGAIDRDSQSYSVLTGVQFPVSRLLTGRVGIGYLLVNFADSRFTDVSGLDYDVALTWNPTELVTVRLNGSRSLERSPRTDVGGVVTSEAQLTVDYELLRNLILSGVVGYSLEDFQGGSIRSSRWNGGITANYLVNRLITLRFSANTREQSSSSPAGREYEGYAITIGCIFHL